MGILLIYLALALFANIDGGAAFAAFATLHFVAVFFGGEI